MRLKRVLWPTDFFGTDLDALGIAGDLVRASEGELFLLHVVGDPAEEVYEEKTVEGKDRAAWALWRIIKGKVEGRLQEVVESQLPGLKSFHALAAFGDPATRILETIRDLEIDVVVLAARREKSLLQEMLLGSVTYKVARAAPCSVLIVK